MCKFRLLPLLILFLLTSCTKQGESLYKTMKDSTCKQDPDTIIELVNEEKIIDFLLAYTEKMGEGTIVGEARQKAQEHYFSSLK